MKISKILFFGLAISSFFCSRVNCDAFEEVTGRLLESPTFKREVYRELRMAEEGIWSQEEIDMLWKRIKDPWTKEQTEINALIPLTSKETKKRNTRQSQLNKTIAEETKWFKEITRQYKQFTNDLKAISDSDIAEYFGSSSKQDPLKTGARKNALKTRAQNAVKAVRSTLLSELAIKAAIEKLQKQIKELQQTTTGIGLFPRKSPKKKEVRSQNKIKDLKTASFELSKIKAKTANNTAFLKQIQAQLGMAPEDFAVLKKNLIQETTEKTPASKTVKFGEVMVSKNIGLMPKNIGLMPVTVEGVKITMKTPERTGKHTYDSTISGYPVKTGKGLLLQAEIKSLQEQIKANPTDELKRQLQKKEDQLKAKTTFTEYEKLKLQADEAHAKESFWERDQAMEKVNELWKQHWKSWEKYEFSTVPHRKLDELRKLPSAEFWSTKSQRVGLKDKQRRTLKQQELKKREAQKETTQPSFMQKFTAFFRTFITPSHTKKQHNKTGLFRNTRSLFKKTHS